MPGMKDAVRVEIGCGNSPREGYLHVDVRPLPHVECVCRAGALPFRPGSVGEIYARQVLEHLGETEQGIILLHHAILAYPQWPTWNKIVGIQDRSFDYFDDQTVRTEIATPDHLVTQGLADWEMGDETYLMNDAGGECKVLLTTDHPQSMRTLAWAHQYRRARVFCYAAGHDNHAWSNPSFRQVVTRGILWAARRL